MPESSFDSWRRCAICAGVALIAACGNQSSTPPATVAGPESSPARPESSADNAAPPQAAASQNASLAELLSGSSPPAPTAVSSPPPARDADPVNAPQAQGSNSAGPGDSVAIASAAQDGVEYARVISVAPATGPHRVCTDETVTERRSPRDRHQVAGTVIGAIAGGVIGHQIGGGRGRDLATVGGAVGGGVVGKQIQRDQQGRDTVTRVVKHCRMVNGTTASAPVYDVVYAYQGQNFHVRLDHDPGDRLALPVRGLQ